MSSLPQRGWQLTVDHPAADVVQIHLSGAWRLEDRRPGLDDIEGALARNPGARRIVLEAGGLTEWEAIVLIVVAEGISAVVLNALKL